MKKNKEKDITMKLTWDDDKEENTKKKERKKVNLTNDGKRTVMIKIKKTLH